MQSHTYVEADANPFGTATREVIYNMQKAGHEVEVMFGATWWNISRYSSHYLVLHAQDDSGEMQTVNLSSVYNVRVRPKKAKKP